MIGYYDRRGFLQNDVIVRNGDMNSLFSKIGIGYDHGQWDGQGIISSTAKAAGSSQTAIGAIMGSDIAAGQFDGWSVGSSDVVLSYAYTGDTNLDGKLDSTDFNNLYGGIGWTDFNYDGFHNADDWSLFDLAAGEFSGNIPTGAASVNDGDTYTLTLPGSGSFIVNWGDGTIDPADVSSASHTYNVPGLLEAINITSSSGFSYVPIRVAVHAAPPAANINEAPHFAMPGVQLAFIGSATDPNNGDSGYTYLWNVEKDGSPFATGDMSAFSFTPDTAATYTITFTATDANGTSDPQTVVLGDPGFQVTYVSPDPDPQPYIGTWPLDAPVVTTFSRTNSDTSQNLNIYYTIDNRSDFDEATPGIDYDPGYLAPGYNDVYVVTIPAGQSSATLTFTPLDDQFRADRLSTLITIEAANEGGVVVPMGVGSKIPVTTRILVTQQNGAVTQLADTSSAGLEKALQDAVNSGNLITELRITGHGSANSIDLANNGLLTTSTGGQQIFDETGKNIAPLLNAALASNAVVKLQACKTADNPSTSGEDDGEDSLAAEMSRGIPGRVVVGYRSTAHLIRGTNWIIGSSRKYKNGQQVY